METLRSLGSESKPFPLKSQYTPAVQAARAAADVAPEASDDDEPEPASKKRKAEPSSSGTWDYSKVRAKWIDNCRVEKQVNYNTAKSLWDDSDAKREYLKDVSVQELKRRKFIGKEATVNPWSQQ